MSETRNDAFNVVKLEDFEEYQVIRDQKFDDSDLPTIDIQPIRKNPEIDSIPKDPIFTKEYLLHHNAILEENGYFARGDYRSPDAMGGKIVPKCNSPEITPHYDIQEHRGSSHCSGFVSLTDKMSVAHAFGRRYQSIQSGYYVYIAEMERGVWIIDPPFPSESEHSAIGPVPIISYRKCFLGDDSKECSSIFIKKNIPIELKKKLIAAQLLPSEKITNPIEEKHSISINSISPIGDAISASNLMLYFDKDPIMTSSKVIDLGKEKKLAPHNLVPSPALSYKNHIDNHRKSLALQTYQDFFHVRDHTLYHPYVTYPKYGLSDSNLLKTAWNNIRLRFEDEKLFKFRFKGLSSGDEPKTAWDVMRLKSDVFLPSPSLLTKSFGVENQNNFQKLQSSSSFGKGSPFLFSKSRLASPGLAYQPFPNTLDRAKVEGISYLNKDLPKRSFR